MIASDSISIADYHQSDFVSHSKLRTFDEYGAYGYRSRHLLGETRREQTDAMRFGQAFETYVQEPVVFKTRYQEIDDVGDKDALVADCASRCLLAEDGKPFSKRHGVKTMKLALLRAAGGDAMDRGDMIRIERMAQSLDRNLEAVAIIRRCDTQITLRDDFAGLDMLPGLQARPDWYAGGEGSLDLKVIARFNNADGVIADSGYFSQAGLISIITGDHAAPRRLLLAENEWPYRSQLVTLSPRWLAIGVAWCNQQIDALRRCYETDEWPLCDTSRTSEPPRWLVERYGV